MSKKTSEEIEQAQYLEDIRSVVSNPSGIRFLKRLFEDGYIFRTTFTGNSQGYFLEGHRNLALKVFQDVCLAVPESVAEFVGMKGGKDD